MKITHLLFWVQDNEISDAFYKKIGFDIEVSDNTHSIVKLHDFRITFVTMRDEEPFTNDSMNPEKGKGLYVYIHVDNVDDYYAFLQKKGIMPVTTPKDWPWGNREFIVKDPDGYKLCFWHSSQ